MTIFNCTYEPTGSVLGKHMDSLPKSIIKEAKGIISTCATAPAKKAAMFAELLKQAKIHPQHNHEFFIGSGNAAVGGYSKFRTELRRLGYKPITKITMKGKMRLTDTILVCDVLVETISRHLNVVEGFRLSLKTTALEKMNDLVYINSDRTCEYRISDMADHRKPDPAVLKNGTLTADYLGNKYTLTFVGGMLKYFAPKLTADGFQSGNEQAGIVEFLSSDIAKCHRFGDDDFKAAYLQIHRLARN